MATASLMQRIHHVGVIIWDEASMSSSRILELVNTLHHNIARDITRTHLAANGWC